MYMYRDSAVVLVPNLESSREDTYCKEISNRQNRIVFWPLHLFISNDSFIHSDAAACLPSWDLSLLSLSLSLSLSLTHTHTHTHTQSFCFSKFKLQPPILLMPSRALWDCWAQRPFCPPFLTGKMPASMTFSQFQMVEQLLIKGGTATKPPEVRLKDQGGSSRLGD